MLCIGFAYGRRKQRVGFCGDLRTPNLIGYVNGYDNETTLRRIVDLRSD